MGKEVHLDTTVRRLDGREGVLLETRRTVIQKDVFSSVAKGIAYKERGLAYEKVRRGGSLSVGYTALGLGLSAFVEGIYRRDFNGIAQGAMLLVLASEMGFCFVKYDKRVGDARKQIAKLRDTTRPSDSGGEGC